MTPPLDVLPSPHEALLPPESFVGLEGVTHLASGGESPRLRGGRDVLERFESWKADGMSGRARILDETDRVRALVGQYVAVDPSWIGFPANVATGMSLLVQSLDFHPQDNVVVLDSEFPSVVYPWASAGPSGTLRVAAAAKTLDDEIVNVSEQIDDRTRVLALSLVSYLDGRRRDLGKFRELADAVGALLVVDASHALGSVSVPVHEADFVFSTCYKWMLGVHGCCIAIWNKTRFPAWTMRAAGWSSGIHEGPGRRGREMHSVVVDGRRFELGNPSYLSVHLLAPGIAALVGLGEERVEGHTLALSGAVLDGLESLGLRSSTPRRADERAGNVALSTGADEQWERHLRDEGILAWAGQGRLRVSTHVYNSTADVDRLLAAIAKGVEGGIPVQ